MEQLISAKDRRRSHPSTSFSSPNMIPLPLSPPSSSPRSSSLPPRSSSSPTNHNITSPASSAHSTSLSTSTLADRRKTQTSRYLTSDDFKSHFAINLQAVRQRERERVSPTVNPIHPPSLLSTASTASTSFSDSSTLSGHNSDGVQEIIDRRASLPYALGLTPGHKEVLSSSTSLKSMTTLVNLPVPPETRHEDHPARTQDSRRDHEVHTESDLGSQLDIITSHHTNQPTGSDTNEDEEEARNEVVRVLADNLAQQIEQNDKLSYEFGILRSTHANLQAVAIDTADELACLREHTRQLVENHNIFECEQHRQESESSIQHLTEELSLARRTICRLHLDACRQSETVPDLVRSTQNEATISSTIPTDSTVSSSPTLVVPSSDLPLSTNDTESAEQPETLDSLRSKVGRLESELADCREARLAAEITLAAFQQVMDPVQMRSNVAEPKLTSSPSRWGLGLLSIPSPLSIPTRSRSNPTPTIQSPPQSAPIYPLSSFSFTTPWNKVRQESSSPNLSTSGSGVSRFGKLFSSGTSSSMIGSSKLTSDEVDQTITTDEVDRTSTTDDRPCSFPLTKVSSFNRLDKL